MRIRIDLGLILPGVLIFLIGLAIFALWFVLAIVSFFLFFIPALHGIFYFVLDLLLASLALMVVGAVVALSGARGWWGGAWSGRYAERLAPSDRMRTSERVGEFFGIVVSLLVLLYFFESQVRGTGFFTPDFRLPEQIAFYGPMVFGMFVSLVRGTYGRKNAVRPLQALQGALIAASAFWLLYVFPFEFTHLTALLPSFIQTPFWWFSNPIGQLLFLLAGIGGVIGMVTNAVRYSPARR